MAGGIDAGIGFGQLAGGVDEEGVPGGELCHTQVFQRTVGMAHLAIVVGQQLEVESLFGAELCVRVDAVDANAENDRVAVGVLDSSTWKLWASRVQPGV